MSEIENLERLITLRKRSMGTQMGQPAVLFVDDCIWDSFVQLAGGLKRAGIRTVRITTSARSLATPLRLFDRTIHLGAPSDLSDLPRLLEGERIVDMQVTEPVAAATNKGIVMMRESGRTNAWSRRVGAMDKAFVAERLREVGLATPQILIGATSEADQIVETLGLPVVRKPRTGNSGDGVSIIRSRQELEAFIAEEQHPDEYFFERFVEGRELQFGGVITGGCDAVVAYETLQRRGALAPASRIRVIDDEAMVETGRGVVAALGITGIMNVNVIRDAEGCNWIHDVNPRVFGSFMSLRTGGVDLMQSYLDWLVTSTEAEVTWPTSSGRSKTGNNSKASVNARCLTASVASPQQGSATEASEILVFPSAFRDGAHSPLRSLRRFRRGALPYRRWLGARYIAYETAHQLQYEVKRLRDRLRVGWSARKTVH